MLLLLVMICYDMVLYVNVMCGPLETIEQVAIGSASGSLREGA